MNRRPLHKTDPRRTSTPATSSAAPRRSSGRRSAPAAAARAAPPLYERVPSGATLRRQYVLCGKPKCTKRHGPYWYAFWFVNGRTRSAYIGKDARMAQFLRARGRDAADLVDERLELENDGDDQEDGGGVPGGDVWDRFVRGGPRPPAPSTLSRRPKSRHAEAWTPDPRPAIRRRASTTSPTPAPSPRRPASAGGKPARTLEQWKKDERRRRASRTSRRG